MTINKRLIHLADFNKEFIISSLHISIDVLQKSKYNKTDLNKKKF
jgi:hypothetical protein